MVAEMTAGIVDPPSSRRSLLDVTELTVFYGSFQALFGVTLSVEPGEAIALIGAPGAGKSTFLRAIAGLVHAPRRAIRFDGRDLSGLSPAEINHAGIALVPEGRRLFNSLTVEENLTIGQPGDGGSGRWTASTRCFRRSWPAAGFRRGACRAGKNRWPQSAAH